MHSFWVRVSRIWHLRTHDLRPSGSSYGPPPIWVSACTPPYVTAWLPPTFSHVPFPNTFPPFIFWWTSTEWINGYATHSAECVRDGVHGSVCVGTQSIFYFSISISSQDIRKEPHLPPRRDDSLHGSDYFPLYRRYTPCPWYPETSCTKYVRRWWYCRIKTYLLCADESISDEFELAIEAFSQRLSGDIIREWNSKERRVKKKWHHDRRIEMLSCHRSHPLTRNE